MDRQLTIVLIGLFAFALLAGCAQPTPRPPSGPTITVVAITPTPAVTTEIPTAIATAITTTAPTAMPTASLVPVAVKKELNACGDVNAPGEYRLSANIEYFGERKCFVIAADNIRFDCLGYNMTNDHKGVAFYIANSTNVTVTNCNTYKFRTAFFAQNSVQVTLDHAFMRGTYDAIRLDNVNDSTVDHVNAWSFSSGTALFLNFSNRNTVTKNVLGASKRGAVLWYSSQNKLEGNNLRNTLNEAFYLYGSDDNQFTSNDLGARENLASRQTAVFVQESAGNKFYQNDICTPSYGFICTKSALTDLGGNICPSEMGCGMHCVGCTPKPWYNDPLVAPVIP